MASKKNITLKKIKESLVDQLDKKGAKTPVFLALVDDYIDFEKQERTFKKNIEERGIEYTATSAQGKEYDKENPSIKAKIQCNKQKLSILNQLGLTIDNILNEEDDFESEL